MRALLQRLAHALLGRQIGIGARECLLGLDDRVSELDERVPRDDVGRCRGGRERLERDDVLASELLLELEDDALGGLLADPRDRLEARGIRSAIARRSSDGGALETTASATFGPMPLTPRRWRKSSRSAASAKPYSWRASSRTCRYVSSVTSVASAARRSALGVAATR